MIGFQCAYLTVKFPPIYWDTACLRVNSGFDIDTSTNYGKVAKAIGKIAQAGIKFSLLDINRSGYTFEPDEKNNQILYGFKALNGTNGETIQEIISKRPYKSFQDFVERSGANRTVTINLIKSGAFNDFGTPQEIMETYLRQISNPKKKLNMRNFSGLINRKILPKSLKLQKQTFNFNKGIKKACKYDADYFALDKDPIYQRFYETYFDTSLEETKDNHILISKKNLKKQYDDIMAVAKQYIQENQEEFLQKFNDSLFQEMWSQYATGNISHWEMESLGMYYHEHELAHINESMYRIVHFKDLTTEPKVEYTYKKGGKEFPVYKTTRICGTVIAKDDVRSSISLLTKESGVVTCKMNRDYYAQYNRQISEIDALGTKHVREKGWFTKGTLLVVNGFRRQDTFRLKSVRRKGRVVSHQLYKITDIAPNGMIRMTNERYGDSGEEE